MTAYDIRIMNLTLKRLEKSLGSILLIDHSVDHEHHITVECEQKQKWPVIELKRSACYENGRC